ncbi:hypothetical protein VBD025_14635 [Virgibacillus flavescens]|uniref:hypothetical protein n=1 Tax=Virgibacillus flavescens TaxID=1611422 RepID=UPI003D33F054
MEIPIDALFYIFLLAISLFSLVLYSWTFNQAIAILLYSMTWLIFRKITNNSKI